MTEESEAFLSRWSRLKRTEKQAGQDRAAPDPAEEPGQTDAGSEVPPDLPAIDSLDEDSDFSVFMQQGVPDDLRQMALRKLWRISPDEIDGLDDYDEDYSLVKMVLDKASDVEEVAKGMPDEQTEEAVAAADGAGQDSPKRPAAETEVAISTETAEAMDSDPAATEDPPEDSDKA